MFSKQRIDGKYVLSSVTVPNKMTWYAIKPKYFTTDFSQLHQIKYNMLIRFYTHFSVSLCIIHIMMIKKIVQLVLAIKHNVVICTLLLYISFISLIDSVRFQSLGILYSTIGAYISSFCVQVV